MMANLIDDIGGIDMVVCPDVCEGALLGITRERASQNNPVM